MSKRILLLAALGLLLLGGWQLLRERKAALEEDLRLKAIRQLSVERVMGVAPDFDGRHVTLRGKVSSQEERQRAESVVAAVDGVRSVANELEIGVWYQPVPLRYFLDAAWKPDGINVRGRVPDEETKALVLEVAAEDFGTELVIDRIEVDGSLGPGDWIPRLLPVLPELTGHVSPGRMKAAEGEVTLVGSVATESSRLGLEERVRLQVPAFAVKSFLEVEEAETEEEGHGEEGI